MNFDKVEKIIVLIMAVVAMSAIGLYINRTAVTNDVVIEYSNQTHKYIKVTVSGEVETPGEYRVKQGSRVYEVIYGAGGITPSADVKRVDLDAIATDGMTIHVPSDTDENAPAVIPVVNINTADFETLCIIPGVGESIAQRIIDYRKKNGNFSDVSEIMNIRGIGKKTFEKMKYYIKTEETQK